MRHINALAMVATCLAAAACAGPEVGSDSLIAHSDADVIIAAKDCTDGSFTGHGRGYSRCVRVGTQQQALARAGGRQDGTYVAALR